jgi:hypothetical protein
MAAATALGCRGAGREASGPALRACMCRRRCARRRPSWSPPPTTPCSSPNGSRVSWPTRPPTPTSAVLVAPRPRRGGRRARDQAHMDEAGRRRLVGLQPLLDLANDRALRRHRPLAARRSRAQEALEDRRPDPRASHAVALHHGPPEPARRHRARPRQAWPAVRRAIVETPYGLASVDVDKPADLDLGPADRRLRSSALRSSTESLVMAREVHVLREVHLTPFEALDGLNADVHRRRLERASR